MCLYVCGNRLVAHLIAVTKFELCKICVHCMPPVLLASYVYSNKIYIRVCMYVCKGIKNVVYRVTFHNSLSSSI